MKRERLCRFHLTFDKIFDPLYLFCDYAWDFQSNSQSFNYTINYTKPNHAIVEILKASSDMS